MYIGDTIYHSENPCLAALRITDPRHDKARIEEGRGGLMTFIARLFGRITQKARHKLLSN